MSEKSRPVVGIPTSVMQITERRHMSHTSGTRYVETLVEFSEVTPVLLPSFPGAADVKDTVRRIDGLLLTGGRANVEPHHYGGPPFPDDEPIDPDRDACVLPLVRACLDEGVPILGSCRGIQEINVALGGSLHYRIHLLPGKMDHRMPRDPEATAEEIFALRHPIKLSPGGQFEEMMGVDELMVNSLHGQGIDRLANGLDVEAVSPDGVIEAITVNGAKSFAVGVQWHCEWYPENHDLSRILYKKFGEAARERARRRNGTR